MATIVVILVIAVVFIAGAITGIVLLVSEASHREDKRRLSVEAPDRTTLAARYLTSLYIRRPGDAPDLNQHPDDQQVPMTGWPHRGGGGRTY